MQNKNVKKRENEAQMLAKNVKKKTSEPSRLFTYVFSDVGYDERCRGVIVVYFVDVGGGGGTDRRGRRQGRRRRPDRWLDDVRRPTAVRRRPDGRFRRAGSRVRVGRAGGGGGVPVVAGGGRRAVVMGRRGVGRADDVWLRRLASL